MRGAGDGDVLVAVQDLVITTDLQYTLVAVRALPVDVQHSGPYLNLVGFPVVPN